MKRTMKVQKKLTVIVIMVLLTIAALGTSTYAWFTLSNTAKVDQIDMGITSGVGIEVSLDQVNWYNKLDSALVAKETEGVRLESVTTLDGYDMKALDGSDASDKTYIKFTIYFRVKNVNSIEGNQYGIYLTSYNDNAKYDTIAEGTALKSKGVDWRPDVDYVDWDGTQKVEYKTTDATKKYYIENSMRVSFKDNDKVKVFDLSQSSGETLKRGYAQIYDDLKTPYGAFSYFKAKTNKDDSNPDKAEELKYTVVYNNQLTKVLDESRTEDNNSLISTLVKAGDYYTGSTEIRVWAEGWDIDCFDSVLSDKIKMQLQFQFGILSK